MQLLRTAAVDVRTISPRSARPGELATTSAAADVPS